MFAETILTHVQRKIQILSRGTAVQRSDFCSFSNQKGNMAKIETPKTHTGTFLAFRWAKVPVPYFVNQLTDKSQAPGVHRENGYDIILGTDSVFLPIKPYTPFLVTHTHTHTHTPARAYFVSPHPRPTQSCSHDFAFGAAVHAGDGEGGGRAARSSDRVGV